MTLIPYSANPLTKYAADTKTGYRVQMFLDWSGDDWQLPDLAGYRDWLLYDRVDDDGEDTTLKPSSVGSYLGTIKAAYRDLMRNNELRRTIIAAAPGDTLNEKQAHYNEWYAELDNILHNAKVKGAKSQDRDERDFVRLSKSEADRLLQMPDLNTLPGLRDAALIATFLCTGVRREEACDIRVEHLRGKKSNELALLIPQGKGNKQRLIPYGDLVWVLKLIDRWLKEADITDGYVFRSFWKDDSIRGVLTYTSLNKLLAGYRVLMDDGSTYEVKPHDLRRTYARRQYDAGMDIMAIKDNLGHENVETTQEYIGAMDASARRGRGVYDFGKLVMRW